MEEAMINGVSRRDFFRGAAATTVLAAAGCRISGGAVAVDEQLSVFLSDIHISGRNVPNQPTYQNPLLDKVIDQVLAMNPRPKRAVVFGDIALWNGIAEDYAESVPKLQRLVDAGIDLYVTTGNHDHREPLFAAYPKQAAITPVPGRVVSCIDLGSADLFLMDTLKETGLPGKGNAVEGTMDEAQYAWLLKAAEGAVRPFFVGAHHPSREITNPKTKKALLADLEKTRYFAGYIHGHNHNWEVKWGHIGYRNRHVFRMVGLPSTGWWGTIGFATMRTSPEKAVLSLVQNDFFFPRPLQEGEARPKEWDEIMHELDGAVCTFRF